MNGGSFSRSPERRLRRQVSPRLVIVSLTLASWLCVRHGECPSASAQDARDGMNVGVPAAIDAGVAWPRGIAAALEAAGARLTSLPEAGPRARDLDGIDALLLPGGSAESIGNWGQETFVAIEEAVQRGMGLVVTGRAASAAAGAEGYSRLLSRGKPPEAPVRPPEGIVLEVTNQSHPVTQCVTHLVLSRGSPTAECSREDGVIGRSVAGEKAPAGDRDPKPPRGLPAVWTRSAGRGRVAVIAIDLDGGKTDPAARAAEAESRALDFLTARAVQWVAGREITIRIPTGLPLLSARLGPLEAGTLPGFPPARGFHRGREIAPVMGFQAIDWLFRADREETEMPDKVLDSLEIEEGSTAADVGAGAGYFTFRLARRVGPRGKVLATDIQEEMLAALRDRMAREMVKNVEPIRATEDDPRLPPGAVDLVLLVDVYHELAKPAELLRAVSTSLRRPADGRRRARLVLVEYRGEDPSVPIKPLHRMTVDQARAEVEPAGFRWVETKDFLPHQHILIFEAR